ncbi:MAG TPA: hypothetical protein VKO41_05000 [Gaiellaceae bacterium]|nr:hypothetical protein [Gaiellaceae bacterium]
MAAEPWWSWLLLSLLFSAPWFIAAIWVWRRTPRDALEEPPSMAELARRRLWAP